MKNKYISLIVGVGIAASLAVVLPAFAQGMPGGPGGQGGFGGGRFGAGMGMRGGMPPGIFGTVASVDVGDETLTVTARMRPNASSTPNASPTLYDVNATNATVMKSGVTSTIASVNVGDMVMVQGTVTGTNVAATVIRDGVTGMMGRPGMYPSSTRGMYPSSTRGTNTFGGKPTSTRSTSSVPFQGNGEPIVAGSITAISSSTITVTNASNVTYTIDVSNATIVKGGTTSTIASLAVGDNVVVQGAVNDTSVTASSVIDQGSGSKGNGKPAAPATGLHIDIFGAIGNFFKHIFGF